MDKPLYTQLFQTTETIAKTMSTQWGPQEEEGLHAMLQSLVAAGLVEDDRRTPEQIIEDGASVMDAPLDEFEEKLQSLEDLVEDIVGEDYEDGFIPPPEEECMTCPDLRECYPGETLESIAEKLGVPAPITEGHEQTATAESCKQAELRIIPEEGTLPTVEIDFATALKELNLLWQACEAGYTVAVDENALVKSIDGGHEAFEEMFGRPPATDPWEAAANFRDLFTMCVMAMWRYAGMSARELRAIRWYTERYVRSVQNMDIRD